DTCLPKDTTKVDRRQPIFFNCSFAFFVHTPICAEFQVVCGLLASFDEIRAEFQVVCDKMQYTTNNSHTT
ncbi:MAG: hypothetical protein WC977_14505, partial [Anaerovoracaceae bacterium]